MNVRELIQRLQVLDPQAAVIGLVDGAMTEDIGGAFTTYDLDPDTHERLAKFGITSVCIDQPVVFLIVRSMPEPAPVAEPEPDFFRCCVCGDPIPADHTMVFVKDGTKKHMGCEGLPPRKTKPAPGWRVIDEQHSGKHRFVAFRPERLVTVGEYGGNLSEQEAIDMTHKMYESDMQEGRESS